MLYFCCLFTLESVVTVGVRWVELFPSVKLKSSSVDEKMSPEPTTGEILILRDSNLKNLIFQEIIIQLMKSALSGDHSVKNGPFTSHYFQ